MHRLCFLIISCAVLTVFVAAQNFPVVTILTMQSTEMKPYTPPFELSSLRTERSKSYWNDNGSINTHIFAGILHEKATIKSLDDKSLTENPEEVLYPHMIETTKYTFRFDADNSASGYRFERNGYYAEFVPADDRTGITAIIIPGPEGLKEDVTFAKDTALSVSWHISTNAVITEYEGELLFSDMQSKILFIIRRADALDAGGTPVNVHMTMQDDILRYTLEITGETTWPVVLDPSIVTTGQLDGRIQRTARPTYTEVRDVSTGFFYDTALAVGQNGAGDFSCYRSYLAFPIPDLETASACTLYINGKSNQSIDDFEMYVLGASQYRSELDMNDYINFDGYHSGSPHTGTILNETWNSVSYSNNWNALVFNMAGLDSIEAASNDTLWIALISKEDYDYSLPTDNEYLMFESSISDTDKPYLSLTYSPLTPPPSEFAIQSHSDGRIRNTGRPTYATARDTASADADTNWTQVGQYVSTTPTYSVYRGYFSFVLPDIYTINACTLYVKGYADFSSDTDFDLYLVGADAYGSILDDDDFSRFDGRQVGSPHTGTILNETWNSASYSSGWNTIIFNPAGLDSVKAASADTLRIAMISRNDYENIPPSGYEYLVFESSASYDMEPYLSLDYSAGIIPPASFSMTALDDSTISCEWNDIDNETNYHIVDLADTTIIDTLPANAIADTISGLTPNSSHIWAVIADSLGVQGMSIPDSCYTLLSPPKPIDIRIMPVSSDTLRISVTEPPNSDMDNTGMEVAAVAGPGANGSGWLFGIYSFSDGGLDCDSTYSYAVRYMNGDGIPSAWSDTVTFEMNGFDTLIIPLSDDSNDDYTMDQNAGVRSSTAVRTGAGDDGTLYDSYFTFTLPWHVHKGGIDSLFITLNRETEENLREPVLEISGIPVKNISPAETLDLGIQEKTSASVPWTVASGAGQRTSPDLREVFREWQDKSPIRDYPYTIGVRLGGSGQPDSVRAVFRDASHPSWDGDTFLTIYYTPGNPDSLDAAPQSLNLIAVAPDSVVASWTDTAAFELGYVLLNTADSTTVAGSDTLSENTSSAGIGGLTPNTNYQWLVRAFSAVDDSSSLPASVRTPARMPGIVAVAALSDSSLSFIINPADNPSSTAFAVEDSLSGYYVDGTVEPSVFRPDPPGEWAWRSFEEWGSAAGDTLTGLAPDSLYVLRAKARTDE